nr:DUF2726 domain-containing protein [Halorhodospira halochloris]
MVIAGVAWLKSQGGVGTGDSETPYTKASALFSPAERSFLGVLDQAAGYDYRVFGKVRVADVVKVRSMADRRAWQRAFNQISSKHFDFILCAKDDLSVVAAVELDDKSHQKGKRGERMVRREAKSGANAGKAFWGCSSFPKCTRIMQHHL